MTHRILKHYNSFGAAYADFSALKASGLHPEFSNYDMAHLHSLAMLAFGGLIIKIDDHERDHAIAVLDLCQRQEMSLEIKDEDILPNRRFGCWKRGTFFGFMALIPLPLLFFFPKAIYVFIFCFILSGLYWVNSDDGIIELFLFISLLMSIPLMLLHAEYIALPRLRKKPNTEIIK